MWFIGAGFVIFAVSTVVSVLADRKARQNSTNNLIWQRYSAIGHGGVTAMLVGCLVMAVGVAWEFCKGL